MLGKEIVHVRNRPVKRIFVRQNRAAYFARQQRIDDLRERSKSAHRNVAEQHNDGFFTESAAFALKSSDHR
jgi:hypothetical protein